MLNCLFFSTYIVFLIFSVYNIFMKKLIVNEKYNGKKLNMFLLSFFPNLSQNLFYKTLRKKDIKINGKRINENVNVNTGDEILVYISDELLEPSIKLDIFYEDSNILILNKPKNIEVTGDNSLTSIVHKLYEASDFKPMPCHRLDRNTSGLILFAKNSVSLDILFSKFKHHEIEKHYLAYVYGVPKKMHSRLEAFLFKDKKHSQVFINDSYLKGYQKIITTYSVIKHNQNTSLLDVEIETGKTHQIRAHLAHIGLPIIGDGKYGRNEINKKFNATSQMLCSYIIKFKFSSDAGILNYLNGKEFVLDNILSSWLNNFFN